ncbi:50S ribosomal protein L32e [Candidatus Bathyarchaeota archaeon]|nr:50S ribosomal protein L32e [Candidatus Bathyarchaeota archaeon]
MAEQQKPVSHKALKLRTRAKRSKPKFVKPESWRYVRLSENWRRPKGLDHKMRRKFKGWPATVNTGYRGPKIARGLHPSGYKEILVHTVEELRKVDPETQAVRIAHVVGRRKRLEMLVEARKKKIKVLNIKELKELKKEPEKEEAEKPEEEEEPEEIKAETPETTEKKPSREKKAKKPKERSKE